MKKLILGILAHVDAGKTTLAESILYRSGAIRQLGRVDHRNTFLDTNEIERVRGITIFSKQAEFKYKEMAVTLLDTPGHSDFSAEMERTLQILDYAVLVISAGDGIQGHTEVLWRLLARYRIPTFVFINKMDLPGSDRDRILEQLREKLSDTCLDFTLSMDSEQFKEGVAVCDETLLEKYMEGGDIRQEDILKAIADRKLFPVYFGSALKLEGVEELLEGLRDFTEQLSYPQEFGAKIYKIARDEQGNRLTYMKITGGALKVKMLLTNNKPGEGEGKGSYWEEKADQIRIYSGVRYDSVESVEAGSVCAVTGLTRTYAGQGLGMEEGVDMFQLKPVLNYQLILPPDCNAYHMLSKLRQLEEEDPQLHLQWIEQSKQIQVQLMGEVQTEILKRIIEERFGIEVEFGPGNIVYKETIAEPVVGVGHFEPLRHYAEVHLLLEPGEAGSGLQFTSECSEDVLERSWQRLVLTHLEEREHPGVLIGSAITDMKITLITGRAHLKHTEGGDFRQATYRAVRHGLKKAKSVLLEPYYDIRLELPSELIGRAMNDIQRMNGSFEPPEPAGEITILKASAPVSAMEGYQTELIAYSKGKGRMFCSLKGYYPCNNQEQIIEELGYDSERDLDNPTGSVFCSHGAGFTVEWSRVEEFMHLENTWQLPYVEVREEEPVERILKPRRQRPERDTWQEDKELEEIFIKTYGATKQRVSSAQNRFGYERKPAVISKEESEIVKQRVKSMHTGAGTSGNQSFGGKPRKEEYLLVDGYNIIFSWKELEELGKENMDAARHKLMDILSNYQGFRKCNLILVFDAYKVKGGEGDVIRYHNIHVVYTKEAETADRYIERVTPEIAKEHHVTVATSDAMEQIIILGKGALRLSSRELKEEILRVREEIRSEYLDRQASGRSYIGEKFDDSIWAILKE